MLTALKRCTLALPEKFRVTSRENIRIIGIMKIAITILAVTFGLQLHPILGMLGHHAVINFLEGLLQDYGYIIVFASIMVESMGVPFPGETMLIIAAAYSAANPELSIYGVVGSAASGAIIGDNLGYWIGREGGARLILKYGKYVGMTTERYASTQKYLNKHGGKAVFFGRFVSVARTWIAVLVGAHHLSWLQFLVYNILGGIVWASLYGALGYFFGQNLPLLEKIVKDVGLALTISVVVGVALYIYLRKRRKAKLAASAATPDEDVPPPHNTLD
jgi:membrane protein DedA with SNARE-associated domain